MKSSSLLIAALLLTGLPAAAVQAGPSAPAGLKGASLAPQAAVRLGQARKIALRARPGRITDQELEKEAGGSGLRYSFDIKAHGTTFEVGVDAKSGAVLENKKEGSHPD